MFVLPPPPRYPSQGQSQYAAVGAPITPMIETNNILSHPTGPEYELLVGEGKYVLKEDLLLATPPPHPSEAPVVNPNPLNTKVEAPKTGTKLSLISLEAQPLPTFYHGLGSTTNLSLTGPPASIQEHPSEGRYSGDASISVSTDKERGTSTSASDAPPTSVTLGSVAPAFGDNNLLLNPASEPKGGRSKKPNKPKNNMTKSNSSFISRVIVNESLSKKLSDRPSDGIFAFANINRAFQWLDLSSPTKSEYLTKVLFTKAHCLCHDVNPITKSASHMDVVLGFSTGEIIWWEPLSQRYTRLNKNGAINNTPVSEIKWMPGSENLFMAAHYDGCLIVYDKDKEDAAFVPEDESGHPVANGDGEAPKWFNFKERVQVNKSVRSPNQKTNPVAAWKLSNQRINAFAFSPDRVHIAVGSEDGTLRIINFLEEELLDIFYSFFGPMLSVCWSPDAKYIVTGSGDDEVLIWSKEESCIVARGEGHQCWVSAVAFDPWRCDARNYRFGSVGLDCRLLLWDFNVGMLHRPKAIASQRHRGSISSKFSTAQMNSSTTRLRSDSTLSGDINVARAIEHPPRPANEVSTLPPVLNKKIDTHPLHWLEFTKDAILTSCENGHIKTWSRPSAT